MQVFRSGFCGLDPAQEEDVSQCDDLEQFLSMLDAAPVDTYFIGAFGEWIITKLFRIAWCLITVRKFPSVH